MRLARWKWLELLHRLPGYLVLQVDPAERGCAESLGREQVFEHFAALFEGQACLFLQRDFADKVGNVVFIKFPVQSFGTGRLLFCGGLLADMLHRVVV